MRSYFRRGGMRYSSRGKPYYRQGGYCFRHTSSRLSPSAAFLRLRRAWVLSRMPQVRSFTVGCGDGLNRLMDAFEAVRGVPPYMLPLRAEKKLKVWHPRATQQQYREIMDRLLAMGDVTTTPDFVPPVAFLPARVILGLFVALVALGLLFANSRPDPRNAPPPKATTSRAIPHKASQSPVAQYAAAIAWFTE